MLNEKAEDFFLLMNRELEWKDFEILKYFTKRKFLYSVEYVFVYKNFSKSVYKESRIISIEDAWKEYK